MKCQILFSGKNKKNISKCCLLKILPRVLSVKPPLVFLLIVPKHSCYSSSLFDKLIVPKHSCFSLFVPQCCICGIRFVICVAHLSFFRSLRRAVFQDCGNSWVSSFIFWQMV